MSARVSQLPVEITILPGGRSARISQNGVEVAIIPISRNARKSQLAVEVLHSFINLSNVHVSAFSVEVISPYTAPSPSTGRTLGPAIQSI